MTEHFILEHDGTSWVFVAHRIYC